MIACYPWGDAFKRTGSFVLRVGSVLLLFGISVAALSISSARVQAQSVTATGGQPNFSVTTDAVGHLHAFTPITGLSFNGTGLATTTLTGNAGLNYTNAFGEVVNVGGPGSIAGVSVASLSSLKSTQMSGFGLIGQNSAGTQTIVLNNSTGDASFAGVVTDPAIAATTVTAKTVTATTANLQTVNVSTAFNAASGSTINMGGNVVHNVGAPVAATDAANKGYVDTFVTSANTSITNINSNLTNINANIANLTNGLNQAIRQIDQNTQGIAVAMAMSGLTLSPGKTVAIGGNVGFYNGKQAAAFQAAVRLHPSVILNGAIGIGFDSSNVGGRVGAQVEF